MNTFFRVCVIMSLSLIIFTLSINLINGLGVFPTTVEGGVQNINESNALTLLTGLDEPNMNAIWLGVTGLTFVLALGLSALTRSIIPIGLHLFGIVFWTSYIRTFTIVEIGNWLPSDLIIIFHVCAIFIFIGAIIGMLTGSG